MKIVNQNRLGYVLCILGFTPLLLYHITIPLYFLNYRPFNGGFYYLLVLILGLFTLGGISFTIWTLARKTEGSKRSRIIYGIAVVYTLFTISNKISYSRKEKHLKKHGIVTIAQINKVENVDYGIRVYFTYLDQVKNNYKGALEFRRNELNSNDNTIEIITSLKDPRIYDILE